MGGVYIAILLSLVSFCVAALSVAKDALWSKPPVPEWIGWVALCAIVIALALAAAVLLCAFRLGPNWMRRTVETLLSPADLKAYPDMPIRKVCERISPDLVEGYELNKVGQGQFERVGKLVQDLRQSARLGRVTVWGRKNVNEGHEVHTPLSEIPAEFWEDGTIDYLTSFGNGLGKAERRIGQEQEWYRDLFFNEQQIR